MKKRWLRPTITILNVKQTAGGTHWHTEYTKNNGILSNGTAAAS